MIQPLAGTRFLISSARHCCDFGLPPSAFASVPVPPIPAPFGHHLGTERIRFWSLDHWSGVASSRSGRSVNFGRPLAAAGPRWAARRRTALIASRAQSTETRGAERGLQDRRLEDPAYRSNGCAIAAPKPRVREPDNKRATRLGARVDILLSLHTLLCRSLVGSVRRAPVARRVVVERRAPGCVSGRSHGVRRPAVRLHDHLRRRAVSSRDAVDAPLPIWPERGHRVYSGPTGSSTPSSPA